jgi:D-galacturonate reductase
MSASIHTPEVTVFGTGQYATGLDSGESASPASHTPGVIALVLADLKRRGIIEHVRIVCTSAERRDMVKRHLRKTIDQKYHGLSTDFEFLVMTSPLKPSSHALSPKIAVVATPDDTHFAIAQNCLEAGMHVLSMKPLVKELAQHYALLRLSRERGLLLGIDYHKRFDPIYADARARARRLGDFSFMASYMSQPSSQRRAFSKWAGTRSDISYYLNSHHVDYLAWILDGCARPISVSAGASCQNRGASAASGEDQISLSVSWELNDSRARGLSIHSASWIAPPSDAHSQQRFHYMGTHGEITVDQARRGYLTATHEEGFASVNPLYMRFTPVDGHFVGQDAYGYRSIEAFMRAAAGETPSTSLALAGGTMQVTAVLHAGRLSLERHGQPIAIGYAEDDWSMPISLA